MVSKFLLYNQVNQLYIYIYPHISSLLHLSPSHLPYPTVLTVHKALSWSPCAMRLLPTSYLFYIWQCIYVHIYTTTLSLYPSLPFPLYIFWLENLVHLQLIVIIDSYGLTVSILLTIFWLFYSFCFSLPLFLCDLMIFCSGMFWFLSCIYYRFLLCGYHEAYIKYFIVITMCFKLIAT